MLVLIGAVLYALYQIGAAPEAAPVQASVMSAAAPAANEREQWAIDFLAALGNAQPSGETVAMVVEWTLAEDAGDGAFGRNNPLNTTQSGFEETQTINSDGVKGYSTREAGLSAAVHTVTNGLYNDVVVALQSNDAEGARQALWASPWAGSHYGYGASWPVYQMEAAPAPAPLAGSFASNPITVGDDPCGWNVQVALDAMGGALRNVQIAPGETFSFNATMGSPAFIDYRTCAGVPGGNWCNLAARYAQVSRALGLVPQFQDHGVGDLGGGPENSVAIWNEGGQAGAGQDLLITNTLNRPVLFQAIDNGGSVIIEGGVL